MEGRHPGWLGREMEAELEQAAEAGQARAQAVEIRQEMARAAQEMRARVQAQQQSVHP